MDGYKSNPAHLLIVLTSLFSTDISAAPLANLSDGQTGRIEFQSTTPNDPWALVRNIKDRTTPTVIWGDLLIPGNATGKTKAVVLGHGSDGVESSVIPSYTAALNQAGIATFVVDSYNPRGFAKHTPESRNSQNATSNISDALHALKLLATHPRIDLNNIYFVGWSTGGRTALYSAFPAYLRAVVPAPLTWAGSVGLYPSGCTTRYRIEHHGTNPSTVRLILAEKDDVTPPKLCADFADQLISAGHNISYTTYPGTYHAFDRTNQKRIQVKDAQGRNCNLEMTIPISGGLGKGYDFIQNRDISTASDLDAALKSCSSVNWITLESNPIAKENAIREVVEFIQSGPHPSR